MSQPMKNVQNQHGSEWQLRWEQRWSKSHIFLVRPDRFNPVSHVWMWHIRLSHSSLDNFKLNTNSCGCKKWLNITKYPKSLAIFPNGFFPASLGGTHQRRAQPSPGFLVSLARAHAVFFWKLEAHSAFYISLVFRGERRLAALTLRDADFPPSLTDVQ